MAKINGKDVVFSPNVIIGGSGTQDTLYANESDYAVCFEWSDGNTNKENRLNRFVQLTDGGSKISFANSTADICGITTDTAGFVENYGVHSEYTSLVGILGIVTVIDNGTCTVGECCMSDDNGYAVPSSNNMGYRVMARVDANKIKVAVKPNDDMIQRIKTDMTTLVNDVDSLKQIMTGVYKYKGSVAMLTSLPNSDKVLDVTMSQNQSIGFVLPSAPSGVKSMRISVKYVSGTYRPLTFVFLKNGSEEITKKTEYFGGTTYGYKDIVVDDFDVGSCDTLKISNTNAVQMNFQIDRIWYANASGNDIGTVIDFDYVSFTNPNTWYKWQSCVEAILLFKNPKVDTYSDGTPIENGDVWNIVKTDDNYAWNGTEWDKLGGTVDLSGYQAKTDLALQTTDKTIVGAINELNAKINQLLGQ